MSWLANRIGIRKRFLYLLVLMLIIFFYNFVAKEEISAIREKKVTIQDLENELIRVENKISSFETDKLESLDVRIEELKEQYDLGLESSLVLLDVERLAQEAKLMVLAFDAGIQQQTKDFFYRQYQLTLMGNYGEFMEWLKLMEELPYYLNLDQLYISKHKTSSALVAGTRTIERLVYIVTINNIAIDGDLEFPISNPVDFRAKPFK